MRSDVNHPPPPSHDLTRRESPVRSVGGSSGRQQWVFPEGPPLPPAHLAVSHTQLLYPTALRGIMGTKTGALPAFYHLPKTPLNFCYKRLHFYFKIAVIYLCSNADSGVLQLIILWFLFFFGTESQAKYSCGVWIFIITVNGHRCV